MTFATTPAAANWNSKGTRFTSCCCWNKWMILKVNDSVGLTPTATVRLIREIALVLFTLPLSTNNPTTKIIMFVPSDEILLRAFVFRFA